MEILGVISELSKAFLDYFRAVYAIDPVGTVIETIVSLIILVFGVKYSIGFALSDMSANPNKD